ncbi:MAG: YchJ family protein [Sulfurimonas sp.]|uniref:YchJ family protein n=1 Tax=Sulfurimonas sp. TaxID=2022749 RepID=UPI0028CE7047|nr:YchJ family protein [Sulfurimonas sp.]MDT8338068.1 YchJ family protein [Sulfurimonas sp.]
MECYCGSKKEFNGCCEPFLKGNSKPLTPEELMRSRYSAYVLGNVEYIINTTAKENRHSEDAALIEEFSKAVSWLKLDVLQAKESVVEFKAYYRDSEGIKVQHEKSNFVYEDDMWLYKDGKHFNSKIERNEPCPCGSGKKYKKCCEKQTTL